jgi:hypothetical protein
MDLPRKIEGLAIVGEHTLAIVNDNDFDVGSFDAMGVNHGRQVKSELVVLRTPFDLR